MTLLEFKNFLLNYDDLCIGIFGNENALDALNKIVERSGFRKVSNNEDLKSVINELKEFIVNKYGQNQR